MFVRVNKLIYILLLLFWGFIISPWGGDTVLTPLDLKKKMEGECKRKKKGISVTKITSGVHFWASTAIPQLDFILVNFFNNLFSFPFQVCSR